MGEIKSTLDLVMEKTKHLSMSSEEKAEQRALELEKTVTGLANRFLSSHLSTKELKRELDKLQQHREVSVPDFFSGKICELIDPENDNALIFTALAELFDVDKKALQSILTDYRTAIAVSSKSRIGVLKDELEARHSIKGSSVVPNLNHDQVWRDEKEKLEKGFRNALKKEITPPGYS